MLEKLQAFRACNPKKTVYAFCPLPAAGSAGDASAIPRRLWQSLALAAGVEGGDKWADVSKVKLSALAQQLTACDLQVCCFVCLAGVWLRRPLVVCDAE